MAMYPKPPAPKKRVTGIAFVVPKMPRAMREPKPLSPKDVAKGMGRKTLPSKRVRPSKPKQAMMPKRIGDLRDMSPRKPSAKTMPKRIGRAVVPKVKGSRSMRSMY